MTATPDKPLQAPAFMDRAPRLGSSTAFTFPRALTGELDNGLRVILVPARHLPLVKLTLMLPCGTSTAPDSAPGLPYLTSRMLDQGAGPRSALELAAAVQDIGASLDRWTSQEHSAVSLHLLRRHLDQGLDLMADVALRPLLAGEDLTRVQQEVTGQVLLRRARPAQAAHLALKQAIYSPHTYARPLMPLIPHIAGLNAADLREFHQRCFRPSGGMVVAAGYVGLQELVGLLQQRFGAWRGEPPAQPPRRQPVARAPRLVLVDFPGATQSAIRVGLLGPARSTPDYTALELLNTVLGGSFTSRLNLNLREKHGYTYGARSQLLLRREMGLFTVSTQVETQNTAAALKEILAELSALSERPVSARELAKARRLLVEDLPGQAETVNSLVGAYSELAAEGLPLDSMDTMARQANALTAAELQRVARRYLEADRATIVVAGDLAQVRAPLERDHGPAQLRDTDGLTVEK